MIGQMIERIARAVFRVAWLASSQDSGANVRSRAVAALVLRKR